MLRQWGHGSWRAMAGRQERKFFRSMFVAASSIQSRRLLLVSTPAASCVAQAAPRVVFELSQERYCYDSILCLVARGASVVISQWLARYSDLIKPRQTPK